MYLRNEITKLEYKQLAESIISLKGITSQYDGRDTGSKGNKIYYEYELTFEESIRIPPIAIDISTIRFLDKYRRDISFNSFYDPNGSKIMKENALISVKQIVSLFDVSILGREIDYEQYNLCHYCKQIKSLSQLVRCNYGTSRTSSSKSLTHKEPLNQGKQHKGNGYRCNRYYCEVCLSTNYDTPLHISRSNDWICPYCKVNKN